MVHDIQAPNAGDNETPQDEIDAAWRDELSRRIDDIESGKVEMVPLDEAFARIRAKLAARHQ